MENVAHTIIISKYTMIYDTILLKVLGNKSLIKPYIHRHRVTTLISWYRSLRGDILRTICNGMLIVITERVWYETEK